MCRTKLLNFVLGRYQVYVKNLISSHDYHRPCLIDRPLNLGYVEKVKQRTRDNPRSGYVSGNWMGLYEGNVTDFQKHDALVNARVAKRSTKKKSSFAAPTSAGIAQFTYNTLGMPHGKYTYIVPEYLLSYCIIQRLL